MNIKELRTKANMTQKEFAEYFGFAKRTVEAWEGGTRKCSDAVLDLIEYKLRNEGMIQD